MSGWFAVKRGITSHPIFKGSPDRLAIWLWLLDNAAWKDSPFDIRGMTVIVPRGSVCASERRIADEVGVGYQVVRTFFARLKTEQMINASVTHGKNIITICNYERYQNALGGDNAAPNAPLTHDQRTKEQVNKILPSSLRSEGATPAAVSPEKVMFDAGLSILTSSGVNDRQARVLLGKWKKEHGAEAVIVALGKCQREGAIDPVSFVQGCFKHKTKNDGSPDFWSGSGRLYS